MRQHITQNTRRNKILSVEKSDMHDNRSGIFRLFVLFRLFSPIFVCVGIVASSFFLRDRRSVGFYCTQHSFVMNQWKIPNIYFVRVILNLPG